VRAGQGAAPDRSGTAPRGGVLAPEEVLLCDSDGFKPEGHDRIAVVAALALSCNTFFEKVGTRLTWGAFRDACRSLGGLDERLPAKPSSLLQRLDVYARGTARDADVEGLEVAGKTGSLGNHPGSAGSPRLHPSPPPDGSSR
jgi:cell division protein FtsI/penicillin-binding protein 2